MRILDRYVTKQILLSYLFILTIFVGLYFVIDMFVNLADILETKPPLTVIVQYYFYSLPLIFLRVSPFSLLISTLYCFGELNKNNEIMSVRTSGISILRIMRPVLFLTIMICVVALFLQEKVLISAQQDVEKIKSQFVKNKLTKNSEEKNLAFTSGNMIFFVASYNPEQKTLRHVKMFTRDTTGALATQTICASIVYEYGFWIAKDLIIYTLDSDGRISDIPVRESTRKINLSEKPEELLSKKSIFIEFASLATLRREITSLKKIGYSDKLTRLVVTYQQKLAEPFMHFFLLIGALPMALEIRKRKAALSALGIGFIFFFVYIVLSSFSLALGKSEVILPLLSAWVAPLFFTSVGLTGLRMVR